MMGGRIMASNGRVSRPDCMNGFVVVSWIVPWMRRTGSLNA